MMRSQGKSSLLDKVGTVVGIGFAKHPQRAGWALQVTVYKTDDQWVMCFAELPGIGERSLLKAQLGSQVPGSVFAKYAVRGISIGLPFAELRTTLEASLPQSLPGLKMDWHMESL
jgi:hypothetical protein